MDEDDSFSRAQAFDIIKKDTRENIDQYASNSLHIYYTGLPKRAFPDWAEISGRIKNGNYTYSPRTWLKHHSENCAKFLPD